MVKVHVGLAALPPEFVERALPGQPGQIVNGRAQRDQRALVVQRREPHRAVHHHHAARVLEQRRQVARVDEVHPLRHAFLAGDAQREAPVFDHAGVQRMVLDQQQRVVRRVARERAHHALDRLAHARERRMHDDLRVRIQLQREQVVRPAAAQHRARHGFGMTVVPALHQRPEREPGVFDQAVPRAVAAVVRKPPRQQAVGEPVRDVVEDALVEVVAGRLAGRGGRNMLTQAQKLGGIPRHARAAVDAVRLERDPVRTDISLLEHMHVQAVLLGDRVQRAVDFAAVAEHQDVGDVFTLHQGGIPGRQIGSRAAVVHGMLSFAIEPVSTAKIDAIYGMATRFKHRGQRTEKRGSRALQH